jgi:arylsulfatase A-like enzyme
MNEGVVVDDCRTVFPSLTGTSHTTLTTGRYPITHGITSGIRFDRRCGRVRETSMSSYEGPSIAELSKERGYVVGSIEEFTLFTRGADVYVNVPSHNIGDVTRFARTVIETKRPQVLYVVFFAVDDAGHLNGPDSRKVNRTVKEVDDALGQLTKSIERSGGPGRTLYVLTSDHGMVPVARDLSSGLETAIADVDKEIPFRSFGRFMQIFPHVGTQQEEVIRSVARVKGVDAILEDCELRALNTGDGDSQGVIISLRSGFSSFSHQQPKVPGYHGGLEDQEARVPLVFHGQSVPPARLPFAETVDVAPTVAAHLGLGGAAFDGVSLLGFWHELGIRSDEKRDGLAQLGETYAQRVQLIRALSELKKEHSNGELTAAEFRLNAGRTQRDLLRLNARSASIRRSISVRR